MVKSVRPEHNNPKHIPPPMQVSTKTAPRGRRLVVQDGELFDRSNSDTRILLTVTRFFVNSLF